MDKDMTKRKVLKHANFLVEQSLLYRGAEKPTPEALKVRSALCVKDHSCILGV